MLPSNAAVTRGPAGAVDVDCLVLPARGLRAGMAVRELPPHSLGAKRRENVRVWGA